MISFTLFKRNIISNIKLLIIFIAILAMYMGVIIWMFDPELNDMLTQYQDIMPEMMAAVGMTGSTGTLIEFINTYLYGFLMTLVPTIFEIIIINKLIMHYIDNGSMACLLATPTSRKKIITTQIVSCILLTILLIGIMTGVGYLCAEFMFPGDLDVEKYIILNCTTLLLILAISGICVFAACFCNETKSYMAIGAGVPLIFYLIQMLSNMGGDLENLKYATIFTLLPRDLIMEGDNANQIIMYSLILAIIAITLYVLSGIRFTKKDLSL